MQFDPPQARRWSDISSAQHGPRRCTCGCASSPGSMRDTGLMVALVELTTASMSWRVVLTLVVLFCGMVSLVGLRWQCRRRQRMLMLHKSTQTDVLVPVHEYLTRWGNQNSYHSGLHRSQSSPCAGHRVSRRAILHRLLEVHMGVCPMSFGSPSSGNDIFPTLQRLHEEWPWAMSEFTVTFLF